MSLYNMLMGNNPFLLPICSMLGFCPCKEEEIPEDEQSYREWIEKSVKAGYFPVGRIRDSWVSEDGSQVGILTRNYGELEWINDLWRGHPWYLSDATESDSTYHRFMFKIPETSPQVDQMKSLGEITDNTPCFERYIQMIEKLKNNDSDEMVNHMKKVGEKIVDGLMQSFNDGKSREIAVDGNSIVIKKFDA